MYTFEDAQKIVEKADPGYKVENGFDYKNLYVFSIVPNDYDESRDGGFLDGFYSVNKETGECLGFAPWVETDFLEQFTDMSMYD